MGGGERAGAIADEVKVGPATVAVERGDITTWEVDAIINAANTTLAMGTGVAAAIKRKGGVLIEEEALRQAPIEVGEAVLTPGGNLAATHVIHAAVMGPDLKTDPETITRDPHGARPGRQAPAHVPGAACARYRRRSTGLPAAAEAAIGALIAHLKSAKTTLKRVVFVLAQDDAVRAFTDTLKRLGALQ